MWKLANFENRISFPKVICQSPSPQALKQSLFTIPKLVNNNKWLFLISSAGICVLIGIGYYLSYKRKKKQKQIPLHSNQLMRSGVWKSLQLNLASTPITQTPEFSQLTTDQLFENGVMSFQQAVNSWRTCCEILTAQETETELDPTQEDSNLSDSIATSSTIHGPDMSQISRRRIRALLLQADYMCQYIDRVKPYSSVGNSVKLESSGSDIDFGGISAYSRSSLPFPDNISDISNDDDRTLEILSQSTDSYESAVLTPTRSSIPIIIIQSNTLYNEAIVLANNNEIFVRRYRTEMLHCENNIDFMAKLHCIRSAFDLLVESEENRLFFETQTRELMTQFLTKANKNPVPFSEELSAMIEYVNTTENIPSIRKELNDKNLKIVGFWDVAIDFALLDAFTDLENLPTPVTMVTQNRWLTPGLRESAITNAVWAVMQGKIRMLENKSGFMSHFYKLGETFMFTLAWGFLGTDEELKEICFVLKNGILSYLRGIFDLKQANYSNMDSLSQDILRIGRDKLGVIKCNL